MTRKLTPASTLATLRREAKRWLHALQAGDPAARERLRRITPDAPDAPAAATLRQAQHALAREHGLAGWPAVPTALGARRDSAPAPVDDARVAWFLQNACPDHSVRGPRARAAALGVVTRMLRDHPAVAQADVVTRVVCGDVDGVRRALAERPALAAERVGPKGWTLLLYGCFTRLAHAPSVDGAVAIAELLLDHGADPNAWFPAGDSRYTPFVGVVGEGEEDRPPHARRDALVDLLLARGAEPYDEQVLYNVHFKGRIGWLMPRLHAASLRLGRADDWADPEWRMLGMGGYGDGARYLLTVALDARDPALVEWLLAHGASPDPAPARGHAHWKAPTASIHDEALRRGLPEIAALLESHGATPSGYVPDARAAYAAACLALDRPRAEALLAEHPALRTDAHALVQAAQRNRADAVALLLDLGTPTEAEGEHRTRALHAAAWADAVDAAAVLLARGAEPDPVEAHWGNTPLDFAVYAQHPRMQALLAPHSRDVWNLGYAGFVDRVRAVLAEEPARARAASARWGTPLHWLPEDERAAVALAGLLLAHGADPAMRREDGLSAADVAERRGLAGAAALLREAEG
ncbi:ankyrin repeat domain-containing protein [Roseisolibacter sp. H3M3-2]|uniref:ankyrin repeat domain-containing protein n=1 Tax=Roseisolibacter sp. H3M3-2 TaxID=3031323 RepID=UPI0023DA0C7B|nr:ankyrin repeat domain-containing protein [Roseisolibacter sp. H3M3-2]MDF1502488.1 hypothetical protein [Roseisolibacter sp. H3M3-2]